MDKLNLIGIGPKVGRIVLPWLVLTANMVGFALLKIYIKSEYLEMEKFFGNDFKKYKTETPDFIPFPIKKWFMAT